MREVQVHEAVGLEVLIECDAEQAALASVAR